jgi:hypothetical protein
MIGAAGGNSGAQWLVAWFTGTAPLEALMIVNQLGR